MSHSRLSVSPATAPAVLVLTLIASLAFPPPPARAQAPALSPDQLAAIRAQIDEIRGVIEGRNSQLNRSAGDVFRQAAQDPKAAVELYAKCYREVVFVREGREDEYRDWEDSQRDTFKDPRFIEGILVQLRYLALSCEAAEAEKLDAVFPGLLAHVEGLTALTQVPSQQLLQGVNQSVFAKAYNLDELLSRNKEWEMVPFDIQGIYEKTVLPHLRKNDPSRLMPAWDRRIAQQTQMAGFVAALEQKGVNRDDRKASENRARQLGEGRGGGIIRVYDETEFQKNTLPALQWARLKDMARFVDPVQGLSGLLAFLKENMEHPKVADWLEDLQVVVNELAGGAPAGIPSPGTPVPATPPVSATPAAPAAPAGGSAPATGTAPATGVVGGVPRGLE